MRSISSRRLAPAVLFAILLARKEPVPRSARLWAHIAVAALFANAVPYLLFAVAEQSVNSSTAGIINATTPLRTWPVDRSAALRPRRWRYPGPG
jgi:drug/metabolite transporter (DMT)-like permease